MKFIRGQYLKCLKIAPDDRFLTYLTTLEKSFDQTKAQNLIHMILTCISMPQYVNQYKFLINTNKHEMQRVYANPNLHERLSDTNEMFSNFISKLELWDKLEQQYDFTKD